MTSHWNFWIKLKTKDFYLISWIFFFPHTQYEVSLLPFEMSEHFFILPYAELTGSLGIEFWVEIVFHENFEDMLHFLPSNQCYYWEV